MARPLLALDWPLRTERLVLRPAEPRDAAPLYAIRSRPDVAEYLGSRPSDPAEWEASFASRLDNLVVELDGVVIGDLYASVRDAWAQEAVRASAVASTAVLGWTLDPSYGGLGYATEAVRALLGVCFEGLGVRRVVAECFADNEPSWRLMERVGMRREAHNVQDSLHAERGWLDGYVYALLRSEWVGRS